MAALLLRYGAQRTLSTPPLRCSSRLALGLLSPFHSSAAFIGVKAVFWGLALELLSPFHSSVAFMGPMRTSRALPSACLARFVQAWLLRGRGWRGVIGGLGFFGGGVLGFLSVGVDGI